ncbi:hypothetical protein [Parendozoicomonas haliclonae]|uniref:Uncharacterized protein n=1 Tax=Parendozoicomonas haliclonae TaxID=1960125 RepID=A0A1X7AR43_9GAMM|nr:hypothetical protein [Parendozoicomonas haliclonae]SMA50784.1 hypothetical protein EHSB41UT_04601 [Parendozoicomonas haliclonae]
MDRQYSGLQITERGADFIKAMYPYRSPIFHQEHLASPFKVVLGENHLKRNFLESMGVDTAPLTGQQIDDRLVCATSSHADQLHGKTVIGQQECKDILLASAMFTFHDDRNSVNQLVAQYPDLADYNPLSEENEFITLPKINLMNQQIRPRLEMMLYIMGGSVNKPIPNPEQLSSEIQAALYSLNLTPAKRALVDEWIANRYLSRTSESTIGRTLAELLLRLGLDDTAHKTIEPMLLAIEQHRRTVAIEDGDESDGCSLSNESVSPEPEQPKDTKSKRSRQKKAQPYDLNQSETVRRRSLRLQSQNLTKKTL